MKIQIFFFFAVMLAFAAPAFADKPEPATKTSDTMESDASMRKNAFSVELLGRGGLYSIDYDYMFGDHLAGGVGISFYSLSSSISSTSVSIMVLPIYGNYYFTTGKHRGFVTAGLDVVSISGTYNGTSTFGASGAIPVIGGGYEFRADGGFLFRAAPYLLIGNGQTAFTVGFGLGLTF